MERKEKTEEKKSFFSEALSWILTIAVAVGIALVINGVIIVNATVPTGSMENTIMPKDRIIALRLTYDFSDPQRGDIAVFKYPDDESLLYVKRVIGLPGETVEIRDGKVYIDNSQTPLDEPYLKEEMVGSFGPYEVPEDCYFMMGDNRNNSLDSRYWEKTYVKKEKMLGKVYFRYFPSFSILSDK